jgi:histidinol phosphatase-like enzyme
MDLDLSSSIMIGDHLKDVEAAHRAGCRGILVTTGRGRKQITRMMEENIGPGDVRFPDAIVQDIRSALDLLREGFP